MGNLVRQHSWCMAAEAYHVFLQRGQRDIECVFASENRRLDIDKDRDALELEPPHLRTAAEVVVAAAAAAV